jgi:hypothetical protein
MPIDTAFANPRGWLLLAVLGVALGLGAPPAASGQSISPERALLNGSSTATLRSSVVQPGAASVGAEPRWPSGPQALLGSGGRNGGSARMRELTEQPGIRSYPDGERALLGRVKPGAGARPSNGSKS